MSEKKEHPSSPFCLRLSPDEWARLRKAAAGMYLSEYARQRLFDESNPPRRTRGKAPVKDHAALSKVLGELGATRIPNNLNQLAKAVNMGELLLRPEEVAALLEACADIREMRQSLVKALGLKER